MPSAGRLGFLQFRALDSVLRSCQGARSGSTPERERKQYGELLDIASQIVERVAADSTSGTCGLLSGMSLASVEIVPEASIFGGWLGYSVELTFE